MKKYLVLILVVLFSVGIFADETVKTADGKKVLLKSDGTWEYVKIEPTALKYAGEAVTVWDSSFILLDKGEDDRSVRLYVHFNNLTDKKIIAVQVHVNVKDSFGNDVFDNSIEDEIIILPNERKKSETCTSWDDNPFMNDEFFDRTWTLAKNGTAKITCKILKVVFEDGTVLKAKEVKAKNEK